MIEKIEIIPCSDRFIVKINGIKRGMFYRDEMVDEIEERGYEKAYNKCIGLIISYLNLEYENCE